MFSKNGFVLKNTDSSPPIIKVNVPPVAPGVDPVQGTSRNWIFLAASFLPISRLAEGEIVLASATTVPGLAPSMTPFAPRMTSSDILVSPTHKKMKSDRSEEHTSELQSRRD